MSAESNEQRLSEGGTVVARLPFPYTRRKEKRAWVYRFTAGKIIFFCISLLEQNQGLDGLMISNFSSPSFGDEESKIKMLGSLECLPVSSSFVR